VLKIQELLSEMFGGRQLCRSINPDEAVAYGAAVQGAILAGVRHSACESIVLVDVTPLSLGIEVQGKHMSIIIPRNTPIPCTKREKYTTMGDYTESLDVRIFEGERAETSMNHLLGEFRISDIEIAKRGEPEIEVSFVLDSNGILNVSAQDKKTGAKAQCQINNACKGLSPDEVERMVQDAERFAKEDAELVQKVQLKSEIESMAFDVEDIDRHLCEETLDWLQKVDLAKCPLSTLETRHRELARLL
jgi:molecular chaperone DnaK (HSP70)